MGTKQMVHTAATGYNKTIDAERTIAAYMIVLVHVRFPGTMGDYINGVGRFAVPLFFMISGYFTNFSDQTAGCKKIAKRIRQTALLFVGASAFYFVWKFLMLSLDYKPVLPWLKEWMTMEKLCETLKYNVVHVSGHLWFLMALLYCYILVWAIQRFRLWKLAYLLIPVLLFYQFYMGEYKNYIGERVSIMLTRNYLFMGFPFFLLGNLFSRYKKFLSRLMPHKVLAVEGIVCGGLLTILEIMVVGHCEIYLGSVVVAVFMLVYASGFPEDGGKCPKIADVGKRYSLYIYILHPAITRLFLLIARKMGIVGNIFFLSLLPVLVCVGVTAAAVWWGRMAYKRNLKGTKVRR